MNWLESCYRLEFNDHLLFNQQINTVSTVDVVPFLDDGQRLLTFRV